LPRIGYLNFLPIFIFKGVSYFIITHHILVLF